MHQALRAPLASVYAHWVILVLQMILKRVAIHVDNVTLIKTVSTMRFVSNSAVASVIVWMLVVNHRVDRMHCVCQVIIDHHVSVVMVMLAIQMISIMDVNRSANVLKPQMHAIALEIVKLAKFAW